MSLYGEKQDDYFAHARTEVVQLIPKFSRRVLDIGCGSGATLNLLKNQNLCERTVGIEMFESAAALAERCVDEVHVLDVEKQPMPSNLGRFELIMLLDVLEHLVDPWAFLAKVVDDHLTEDGRVLISLPNARHFTFVLPMLMGKLDYVERGIRDKTHLRFFTRRSALSLLAGAHLKVEKELATSLDIKLNSGKLNAVTLGLFSGFLTSQHVFCSSKESIAAVS